MCSLFISWSVNHEYFSLVLGFMGAMISNLAFVFRNIFSKKGMKGKSVSGMNYYACLSILSLIILTPFAIAMEGPKLWAAGWQKAISDIGPNFVWYALSLIDFILLKIQISYLTGKLQCAVWVQFVPGDLIGPLLSSFCNLFCFLFRSY